MHRHATLNRIFRLVWSPVHQAWVAVSETARGRGKGANRKLLLAAAALAASQLAQAGPTGGQVTNGSGTVNQAGTTTTINQSSQNLSLQWNSFNTTAAETVNFVQPSRAAVAVNRIADTSATRFFGKLNANGQVYVINPNGVLFGAGSQVNVGGLVASTLDIDDASRAGAVRRFSGGGSGTIVNQGAITTIDGGYVAFLGKQVGNQGAISAPKGSVALGAGRDVTLSFAGNSLVGMQVHQSTLDNLADNGGLIRAEGGAVILSAGAKDAVLASVVNNTGLIEARSAREVNGTIVLDGGQNSVVSNSGTLDASGRNAGEHGGSVRVLGQEVGIGATSRIDVAGDTGGGTALIGGNFLGAGPERNAQTTSVAAGSTVLADAVTAGAGGKVAVWSDGATQFNGRISARGGAAGGNGGSVETSGKVLKVGKEAVVNTLAPHGVAGDWLLDPQDITIGGYDGIDGDITGGYISEALNNTNVTIKTGPTVTCSGLGACSPGAAGNGDIVILNGAWIGGYYHDGGQSTLWTAPTTLTLSAYRNVQLVGYATIDWNGPGIVNLRADNTGTGVGTVLFGDYAGIYGGGMGTMNLYYNPVNLNTPTNYAGMRTVDNEYAIFNNLVALNTYMLVNVTAGIANKSYDGTLNATLSGVSPRALPTGVTLDISGATASFLDKNAGVNKATLVSGVGLSGANASQYVINGLDSNTATIAKADLAVSGINALAKTYDGTNAAQLAGTASVTAFGADVVNVAGTGTGLFGDKNAGAGKAVSVTGYTLTGTDAGNYNAVQPAGLIATINQASLAVTGVSAASKTYDATLAATLAGTAAVSAFGGDVVNVTGTGTGTFTDKNAGAGKAVTVTGYALAGTDAANYNIVQPTGLTATINQANLALTGLAAADKIYDATTTASLSGSASVAALGADVVNLAGTGVGNFVDKNAGVGKAVTVSGYTLTGADAGNYNLVQPAGLTASIARANLALTGVTATDKTYDGTLAATLAGTAAVTAFGSDVVNVAGSGAGTFADKNAGAGKAVTVSGYTLAGLDAGNYNLLQPAGLTASIARANLAVSGIVANNKTYDGTVAATLGGSAAVAAFGSDVVNVAGSGTGVFGDKNAGAGKAVTVTGYTLSGLDAGNYTVVQPAGLTATIGQAALAIGGLAGVDKVYDSTTSATLSGTASVAAIGSDVVNVSGGSAAFADKNAGTGKAIVASGFTLTGLDAGNYTVLQPAGLTANIGKASLALAGVSALGKTYDATTAATLAGTASVSAFGSDVVNVAGAGTGAFGDKNAGTGKAVTVSGYTLTGLDAGNYNLVAPAGLTADIARANLAVSGVTANDKTYDGTVAATLGGAAAVSAFGSDVVTVAGSGTGVFADKNAGAGKAVTVSGYTLDGVDAGNYTVVQPTGVSANIGQAGLSISGLSALDKVYDSTTAATLSGTASVAAIGSDVVTVGGDASAAFADKNAGAGKPVLVSGLTLGGADAGNYSLAQPSGLSATISRANLALTGVTANGKTYDGTTAATLGGDAGVTAIGSDVVSLTGGGTGAFVDKNAGTGKAVLVSGFALAGADAGNYNLVAPGDVTADIARASLAVSGVIANDKTYDGTTVATLGGNAAVSAFGNDSVNVAATGSGVFADKNAGAGKAVSVTGYTLSGLDADNYNIVQPDGLSATIRQAGLTLGGLSAQDKVYDSTTGATLSGTASVSAIGDDVVGITGNGSAAFADKNAGTGKDVVVSGFALNGADAANYTLAQPSGLRANISRANLALSGVAANGKIYDGTTAATLSGSAAVTAIGSDQVTVAGSGTGVFADRNAGTGKAVTVSGYALDGVDAGNYNLVVPTGLRADIARAQLTVSGITASDKLFDGTTSATVSTAAALLAGRVGADNVTLSSTGAFADAAAGSNKTVNLINVYGGADVANYTIVDQATAFASIASLPAAPVVPVATATAINDAVVQVQSTILPPQASAQAQSLNLASTLVDVGNEATPQQNDTSRDKAGTSLINTRFGAGPNAPTLQIQNGGVQLPPLAINRAE